MLKNLKRALSTILSFVLVLSAVPLSALAEVDFAQEGPTQQAATQLLYSVGYGDASQNEQPAPLESVSVGFSDDTRGIRMRVRDAAGAWSSDWAVEDEQGVARAGGFAITGLEIELLGEAAARYDVWYSACLADGTWLEGVRGYEPTADELAAGVDAGVGLASADLALLSDVQIALVENNASVSEGIATEPVSVEPAQDASAQGEVDHALDTNQDSESEWLLGSQDANDASEDGSALVLGPQNDEEDTASGNSAWTRLAGSTRYGTMSAIVSERFGNSKLAIVASGEGFADALVAAPLAGATMSPIILTGSKVLPDEAASELVWLGVESVYLMGGYATISADVEASIAALGIDVTRVAGDTRYATSVATMGMIRALGSSSDAVVITSGKRFADALSIGPWAFVEEAPVILTGADGMLTQEEVDAITSDPAISRVILVGGTSVVSDGVKGQLGYGYEYVRLAGGDRYETNCKVMEWSTQNGLTWRRPAIASGETFPDALVGSALCGMNTSVLALNSEASIDAIRANASSLVHGYVLGGEAAVPVLTDLPKPTRPEPIAPVIPAPAGPSLDGVDISGWNAGVDTESLEADFVIIKSTEGIHGTIYNPEYTTMADDALASGKLIGFYHYANGGDAVAEADCFYESIKDYKGRAIACLDWEGQGNKLFDSGMDVAWCKKFLDRLKSRMGGTPVLYTSKNYTNTYDWSLVAKDYPLWGAEYASNSIETRGYEETPWQSTPEWGAWGRWPTIFQYSSTGVLDHKGGYFEYFDFNKFYGSANDWRDLQG